VPVESGSRTLKDALNEAMRDWVTNVETTFYIIARSPAPSYPMMVRDFQSVIGRECVEQMPRIAGRDPDVVIACVGGAATRWDLLSVPRPRERAARRRRGRGEGLATGRHSASLTAGRPGVLHGNRTYLLQDEDGRSSRRTRCRRGSTTGCRSEHAYLKDSGRAQYETITDDEALAAFHVCCRTEASSRAGIGARARLRGEARADAAFRRILLVNLSGRGDKDMNTVAERSGLRFYCRPSAPAIPLGGAA